MEVNKFVTDLTEQHPQTILMPSLLDSYFKLLESLKKLEVIDYFMQLKIIEASKNLTFECLFFDNRLIHLLNIESMSIQCSTFPINTITAVYLTINSDQQTRLNIDKPTGKELQLRIKFSLNENDDIGFSTDNSKFSELLRIKDNLTDKISSQ
jgi:hypothetical protein